MIAQILEELRLKGHFEVVHWPFFFTREVRRTRRAGLDKILELFAVLWRLAKIWAARRIDAILYPVGGPQFVPLVRDVCLLPWALLASNKVILHFHAAGIAETINDYPSFFRSLVRSLYSKCAAAIVMTEFGKSDAYCMGVTTVKVVPHVLTDAYKLELVSRTDRPPTRLLYVGHFSEEKGTAALLKAFAGLRQAGVNCVLELVGECLPSYSEERMAASIQHLGIKGAVVLSGALSGQKKWEAFGRADLFVFPSLALESFGLVMAEAMMWALPLVACDWRGNREVLGSSFGGVLFQPKGDLGKSLMDALQEAFASQQKWSEWGKLNRQMFVIRYKVEGSANPLERALEEMVHFKTACDQGQISTTSRQRS